MSVLTYNGITLPYAYNREVRMSSMYDDQGTTDRCYLKVELESNAVVNANYLSVMAPDLIGKTDNAAVIMSAIYDRLMTPRKLLTLTLNTQNLLPTRAGVLGTVDAKNGPQPQYCNITQLTTVTFLIQYKVVAYYWVNPAIDPNGNPIVTNNPGSPILYNRWTETQDIDKFNFSTITRRGKLVIRSDNVEGFTPDQLRVPMAVVQVPAEFIRESSHYTIDPSGLGLSYEFEEKEQFKLPPAPAFEADGETTYSTTKAGALGVMQVRVHLKGCKFTEQAQLVSTAMGVCAKKLNIGAKAVAARVGFLESSSIKVWMYSNEVEVNYRAKIFPTDVTIGGTFGLPATTLCVTPLSDQGYHPPQPLPLTFGSANILVQAAAYWDPDNIGALMNKAKRNFNVGLQPGQAGKTPE